MNMSVYCLLFFIVCAERFLLLLWSFVRHESFFLLLFSRVCSLYLVFRIFTVICLFFHVFFLLGVHWVSWIYNRFSFNLGSFQPLFYQNFLTPFLSWDSHMGMLYLLLSYISLRFYSFVSSPQFPHFLDCMSSNVLLFSSTSNLLSPSSDFFHFRHCT